MAVKMPAKLKKHNEKTIKQIGIEKRKKDKNKTSE